jgi:hypothetical protein
MRISVLCYSLPYLLSLKGGISFQFVPSRAFSAERRNFLTATPQTTSRPVNGDFDDYSKQYNQLAKEDDSLFQIPRHSDNDVNSILMRTESILRDLHKQNDTDALHHIDARKLAHRHEVVYSNSYVDLSKINVVGFDFDYTLVSYTDELLELIYEMALKRLVSDRQYPIELLESNLAFDPYFSIRGLAVDLQTGWITHLSYTHKVAVAYEGREKVSTARIVSTSEYTLNSRPVNKLT